MPQTPKDIEMSNFNCSLFLTVSQLLKAEY